MDRSSGTQRGEAAQQQKEKGRDRGKQISPSGSRCLEPRNSTPLLQPSPGQTAQAHRRAGVSLKRKTKAGRTGEDSKPRAAMLPAISDPALYEKNKTNLPLLPKLCAMHEMRQDNKNVPWFSFLL